MNQTLIRHARRVVGLIGIALFGILLIFTLFTHLVPLTGRQLFIVGGGSMEPSIALGSLVITNPVDPMTIAAGDVVTIRADNGVVVTHRVQRVVDLAEGRFFELKGDANPTPDASLVPARAIVGAAAQSIPFAGYAQQYLATLPGMLSAIAILGALFLLHLLLEVPERSFRQIPAEAQDPVGP
jgi:signal peptidase I